MSLIKIKKPNTDPYLFPSICIFLVLILISFGSVPYLDGNIDFVKNYDFFSGGFTQLFRNWISVHPPGKEFIVSLFFAIFGINSYSYTLIGPVFGILGIVLFYSLILKLFDKKSAAIGAFLLAVNPLFISVGIFGLTDYLLAIFAIGSFYFYLERKYILLLLFLNLSVLSKETGLLLPISLILAEIVLLKKTFSLKKSAGFLPILTLATPFLTTYIWHLFLEAQGKPLWSDWNFSATADKGSIYTIIHNLTSFSFLNKYAYQNWLHLFILNFNWIYWLIMLIGLFFPVKKYLKDKTDIYQNLHQRKTLLSLLIFFFSYSLTALTYQTYTIPRYILPLIPILLLAVSISTKILIKNLKLKPVFLLIPLFSINFVSLFFSFDPVSIKIWSKEKIMGENLYGLKNHLAGNDGITYNMQYTFISKNRTHQILKATKTGKLVSDDCYWIFPDPRNDQKTLKILRLNIDIKKPCIKPKD